METKVSQSQSDSANRKRSKKGEMAHHLWFADEVMERAVRWERVFRDRTNPLEIYNNEEFLSRFCLPKEAILRLTDDLSESLVTYNIKEPQHSSSATGLHCVTILCNWQFFNYCW